MSKQRFSPALARKNLRAKERRGAKAEEAARRAVNCLKRKFSQHRIEIWWTGLRRTIIHFDRRIHLFNWARWEFFYAWHSSLSGKFIIMRHPLYGEWQVKPEGLIEKVLREGGIDV